MIRRVGQTIASTNLKPSGPIVTGNAPARVTIPAQDRSPSVNFAAALADAPIAQQKLARLVALRDSAAQRRNYQIDAEQQAAESIMQARTVRDSYMLRARQTPQLSEGEFNIRMAEYEAAIERARQSHAALRETSAEICGVAASYAATEARCKKRLAQYKGGRLVDAPPTDVPAKATLESVRAEIAKTKAIYKAVEEAPPPFAEAEAAMLRELDKQIARGRPRVALETKYAGRDRERGYDVHRISPAVKWPTLPMFGVQSVNGREAPEVFDAQAMFSWMFADRLRQHLTDELQNAYSRHIGRTGVEPLANGARKARLAELDADLLALSE